MTRSLRKALLQWLLLPAALAVLTFLPLAYHLVHQPAMEGMQGQASDIAIVADELDRMTNWLCETLAFHTDGKKTAEQIAADIQRDKILTADAAKGRESLAEYFALETDVPVEQVLEDAFAKSENGEAQFDQLNSLS